MIRYALFGVIAVFLPFSAPSVPAQPAYHPTYQTVHVADGIVSFIASESNTDIVSGNCTAIIGDDGVLVVDSTSFPSHARKIIAEIRQLTDQPVRFLVHTHWHPDHIMGDNEFRTAFPGMAFVSTNFTQKAIAELAPKYIKGNAEQGAAYAVTLRKEILDGKDQAGKPLTDADKKYVAESADAIDFAVPEYQQYKTVLPNVGFDDSLTIRLGKREVRLFFLGRGNTSGDAVIFVPDAKVAIAGDLLVAPTPYSYGSFLTEWIQALNKLKALDPTVIVPGHGPVEHDFSYLDLVSGALQSVLTQVRPAVQKHLSLEDTRKKVDLSPFKDKFCNHDYGREIAFRTAFVDQAIARAFAEITLANED